MVSAVVAEGATSTRSGNSKNSAARWSIRPEKVAEKRRFCRLDGMTSKMERIWGINPMSIILSASSITMVFKSLV